MNILELAKRNQQKAWEIIEDSTGNTFYMER